MDVFGAEAQADHAGGDPAEDGEVLQEEEWDGEALEWGFGSESGADETLVCEDLNCLSHAGGKFAAGLDMMQLGVGAIGRTWNMGIVGVDGGQSGDENICGGDSVLNGEIDADSPDGGHGVGGVANAEEAAAGPVAQAIDGDREQLDVAPLSQLGGAALEEGGDGFEVGAKSGQAIFLDGSESAFGDDVGALPVITAVESCEELTGAETA